MAWARAVEALANPADVVEWNTDKRYLAELAAAGLPVVPTTWLAPGEAWAPPESGEYVIKPSVGAGSPTPSATVPTTSTAPACRHAIARLHAAGRMS